MAISGNKGEWSEIYTLLRLLGEGKIHAGDAQLNKLEIYYPIISVIRQESKRYEYKPDVAQNIVIIDEDGNEFARISMDKFMAESRSLLDNIRAEKASAFEVPSAEAFMQSIGCTKLKAPSRDKADIHIVIHDLRTNMTPELGFSIKSQLGSASTLLNAGTTTNIRYRLTGTQLTDAQISQINAIKEQLPRMKALLDAGCTLQYAEVEHATFKNNLLFIDCCLPQILAECLAISNTEENAYDVKTAVEHLAKRNPLNYTGNNVGEFYEHKIKSLLLDSALGMTPARQWNGRYDANGGYIVVRSDGEIVCYHFYNRNDVEDYLYYNTRFEHPSRKRYGYGEVFRGDDGQAYIKLNLQIRFKK